MYDTEETQYLYGNFRDSLCDTDCDSLPKCAQDILWEFWKAAIDAERSAAKDRRKQ